MKLLNSVLLMAGTALFLMLGTSDVAAQGRGQGGGRGGFDPEQMRARMMERYKEAFGVTSDAEWTVIETRITKVMEARRDIGMGGGRGFGRPPGGGRGPDREVDPVTDALQKAIDAKAPAEEIKAKLAKYRDARKAKEAALEKAQDELKKVLTVRQEAVAVMMRLVD